MGIINMIYRHFGGMPVTGNKMSKGTICRPCSKPDANKDEQTKKAPDFGPGLDL